MKKISALPNSNADGVGSFPYGSFKAVTSPTSFDGTPIKAATQNDKEAFFQRLLSESGVVPDGNNDNPTNSQIYKALRILLSRGAIVTASATTWSPAETFIATSNGAFAGVTDYDDICVLAVSLTASAWTGYGSGLRINLDGLGAVDITKNGKPTSSGDLIKGKVNFLFWNGTSFDVVMPRMGFSSLPRYYDEQTVLDGAPFSSYSIADLHDDVNRIEIEWIKVKRISSTGGTSAGNFILGFTNAAAETPTIEGYCSAETPAAWSSSVVLYSDLPTNGYVFGKTTLERGTSNNEWTVNSSLYRDANFATAYGSVDFATSSVSGRLTDLNISMSSANTFSGKFKVRLFRSCTVDGE